MVSEVKKEFAEEQILRRGFRKIKMRWTILVTGLLMLIPIIGLCVLGYNEQRGEGVCFSNIDDIYRCIRFVKYIEKGDFGKVADSMEFSDMRYDFADKVRDLSEAEFVSYMRGKVEHKLEEYRNLGISIRDISYDYAYKIGNEWQVELAFYETYPDGSCQRITVTLDANTLRAGAYSVVPDTQDIYIDEILSALIQEDPLRYKEMEVTFSLKEGERAIVSWDLNEEVIGEVESVNLFHVSYGTGYGVYVQEERLQQIEASVPGEYAVVIRDRKGEKVAVEDIIKIKIEKY